MSISYGPNIVTDGLVLHLDAGNSKSYPGSGSTWYDLSGNGNNGTISGSVSHSFSINNGVFTFPKTINSYIQVSSPNLRTTNHTVMCSSRYVSTTSTAGRVLSGGANNWLLGHWSNSTVKHYAEGWVTDSSGSEQTDTDWRIYASLGNYSADQWTFYVDGLIDTGPNNGGAFGPNGFTIGRYYNSTSEYSNSQFGFLMAYNRVLTDAEVKQNYNALKGRYGL